MICSHCGASSERDTPIERDGFVVDPRGAVTFDGREILLSVRQRDVFYMLAKNRRDVEHDAILNRLGSEVVSRTSAASPQGYVYAIRRTLRAMNAPCPIQTVKGVGYRWQLLHSGHCSKSSSP